jgi:hypothetical protein
MPEISNSIKFEKITLWVSTQCYSAESTTSGLDYILEGINNHLDRDGTGECKLLDYDSEDYQLVPKPKTPDA